MKGMIDKQGFLRIYRKNEYKLQICPFSTKDDPCGDWCPLFEEPEKIKSGIKNKWKLALCKKVLVFDEFVDERNIDQKTKKIKEVRNGRKSNS